MNADELRSAISEGMPRNVEDLSRLFKIPSIAFPDYDTATVRNWGDATAEILEARASASSS